MIKDKSFILIIVILALACKDQKSPCDAAGFKDLQISAVRASLKVPEYIVTDTMRCCDASQIFNRELRSVDSSVVIIAGVKSFEKDSGAMITNMDTSMVFEKEYIESGEDSMHLITQVIKTIGNVKVGYLKYLDAKRKRYEGKIFFIREKRVADISLYEKYISKEKDKQSIIDCVFENMKLE